MPNRIYDPCRASGVHMGHAYMDHVLGDVGHATAIYHIVCVQMKTEMSRSNKGIHTYYICINLSQLLTYILRAEASPKFTTVHTL